MRTLSSRIVDVSLAGSIVALLFVLALPALAPSAPGSTTFSDDRNAPSASAASLGPDASPPHAPRAVGSAVLPEFGRAAGAPPSSSTPVAPATRTLLPASDGLTVGIQSSPAVVDAGVSTDLVGFAFGGSGPYQPYWSLATGQLSPGWSIRWTAPEQPTSVNALFEVRDHAGILGEATSTIRVVAAPFLEVGGSAGVGDVGAPFLFPVNLTGGVGPFQVHFRLLAGSSNSSIIAPSDGNWTGAVVPANPGPVWVLGSVTDADNQSFTAVSPVGRASAPPTLSATSVPFAEVGYPTPLPVSIADGTPPFAWSAVLVPGVSAVTPAAGTLPEDGPVPLSATFDRAGLYALPLRVVDGSGVSVSTNLSVNVSAGLNISVSTGTGSPVAGAPLALVATVGGGLPPYSYRMTLSDNELASGNTSAAGRIAWTATPVAAGYLVVKGTVTDSSGRAANATFTLYVSPAADRSGSSGGLSTGAGLLALGGAGAGAFLVVFGAIAVRRWLRRRPATGTAAGAPDGARSAVRELLAEADDGIDRSTLGLLAEERGVGGAELDTALAEWQRAGRIQVDDDGEGRRIVRWVPRPVGPRSPGPPPDPHAGQEGA